MQSREGQTDTFERELKVLTSFNIYRQNIVKA